MALAWHRPWCNAVTSGEAPPAESACRAPCVDVQYCQASNKLYTVHDATYKMASPTERNTLQVSLPAHNIVQGSTGLGCIIQCLLCVL